MMQSVQVPYAAADKKQRFYRPELDALRFFAFLMVFLHHLPPFRWPRFSPNITEAAGFGVSIFFLLSAYLIAELLMREKERTGSIHIKAFFLRRILRIWPLYFLAILLGITFGHLTPLYSIPIKSIPYLLFLAGNFFVAAFGWHLGVIGPLWSLSIEEQFYLAIPSIAKFGGKRALATVSLACLATSYGTLVWLGARKGNLHEGVWVNSFVQFQFFAAGTLLALALHRRNWVCPAPARSLLMLAGLVGLFVTSRTFHLQDGTAVSPLLLCSGYLVALFACTAIFLAFLNARLQAPGFVLYLGRISFGLYIFHSLAIALTVELPDWLPRIHYTHLQHVAAECAALLLTILMAATSYQLFEKRILRFKERFTYVKSGVIEPASPS